MLIVAVAAYCWLQASAKSAAAAAAKADNAIMAIAVVGDSTDDAAPQQQQQGPVIGPDAYVSTWSSSITRMKDLERR
jgi:hypothetical protein